MRSAAVACVGARLASEDGGEFASAWEEEGCADGEDASVDLVKQTASKAARYGVIRQLCGAQLLPRHQSTLPLGYRCNPLIGRSCG